MKQHSYNTQLTHRLLWYDGESSYDETKLTSLIKQGYNIKYVNNITPEIDQYNKLLSSRYKIQCKDTCNPLPTGWNIPEEYKTLNVVEYISDKHNLFCSQMNINKIDIQNREIRLANELVLYHKLGLINMLRAIIYIINTLTNHNIVWGIGRGSSVASYVLFIIGAHDVDSFKYDLDIIDFLHD